MLTAEGRRRLRRTAPVHLTAIQEHFTRHLSDEDQRRLTCALERVLAAQPGRGPAAR